jgi:hypothetical protein
LPTGKAREGKWLFPFAGTSLLCDGGVQFYRRPEPVFKGFLILGIHPTFIKERSLIHTQVDDSLED